MANQKSKAMKKKLYVVLVENSHTGGCDIVGGVFDNKKDMNKFIEDNELEDQGYEIEVVMLNQPNYSLIK